MEEKRNTKTPYETDLTSFLRNTQKLAELMGKQRETLRTLQKNLTKLSEQSSCQDNDDSPETAENHANNSLGSFRRRSSF